MAFLDELAAYGDRVTLCPQDETGLLALDALLGTPHRTTRWSTAAAPSRCSPRSSRAAPAGRPGRCTSSGSRRSRRPSRCASEAFEVVLQRSELTLTVPPDRSILSVVEEAGVGVLSSCAEGTCGTCETPVLDGRAGPPRLGARRGRTRGGRLHDDLRLPLVHLRLVLDL